VFVPHATAGVAVMELGADSPAGVPAQHRVLVPEHQ